MKRATQIFSEVSDFHALIAATRRATLAKGSRPTREVASFCAALEPNCLTLRRALISGAYQPGAYRSFMIFEPKARLISAAPFVDRVVHHSLCAALEPHFERFSIYDSYACRRGKGLHLAVERAQRFSRRFSVFLKLDIQHYFESASHHTLKLMLRRRFKDRPLLDLCDLIIDRGAPGSQQGNGLPIGNLTSQHFANFYLSHLDRFIKQTLRCKGYLRYMDDMLLFSDDFKTLREYREKISTYIQGELQLNLKTSAERLDWVTSGIPFLGLRISPRVIRFDSGRKRRLRARLSHLNRLSSVEVSDHEVASAISLHSWANLADSRGLLESWYGAWGLRDD